MSDASASEARRRRPILVWVIAAFIFLSAAWSIAGVWLLFSVEDASEMGEEAIRMREAIGPIDIAIMGLLVVLNLVGAVALFRLKRAAVTIFGIVVALTLLNQLWLFLARPEIVAAQGPITGIVGVVLPLVFFMYASRLARRGVLD
jgi:hypothetical protein